MAKHVIFLGAGASRNSGYPLANGLRVRISSRDRWHAELVEYEGKQAGIGHHISTLGQSFWGHNAVALDLFRMGGFATVDEFCKLAGGNSYHNEVDILRSHLRAALGLFNPEESFEKSEYYPFVQSLFGEDLFTLRDNITILSYNYDPYLEFLLYRALECRSKIVGRGKSVGSTQESIIKHQKSLHDALNAATSGFFSMPQQDWLTNKKNGFCLLKLHGSILRFQDITSDFKLLFSPEEGSALKRAQSLLAKENARDVPPIFFPWEMINKSGRMEIESSSFGKDPLLRQLTSRIWDRARNAVQSAEKISFVGLSMHDYLMDGLRYLFKDFARETDPNKRLEIEAGAREEKPPVKVEVVVANPENEKFRTPGNKLNLASPCGKVAIFLRREAPNLTPVRSSSERFDELNKEMSEATEVGITQRNTFQDTTVPLRF